MADINYTEYNRDNQYLRKIAGLRMSNNYTDYKSDNELLKIISENCTGATGPQGNSTIDTYSIPYRSQKLLSQFNLAEWSKQSSRT